MLLVSRLAIRRACLATTILLLAALSFGCGGGDQGHEGQSTAVATPAAAPVDGGRLVVAIDSEPGALNPLRLGSAVDATALGVAHFGLVRLDLEQNWQPRAATGWQLSEDATELVFQLRQDLVWSDGHPFVADDIVASFELFRNPATAYSQASLVAQIASVDALDQHSVRFRFDTPLADPFQACVSNPMPAHIIRGLDPSSADSWELNRAPLTLGAYRLREWVSGQRLVFERNPHFPGPPAHIDEVELRIIPESATQMLQLELGEVDVVAKLPMSQLERMRDEVASIRLAPVDGRRMNFLQYHCEKPPFDDARVRRAFGHIVDRTAMTEGILFGFANVAATPLPPAVWMHDSSIEPEARDLNAARVLLSAAGYEEEDGVMKRGGEALVFDLITRAGDPIRENVAVMVRAQLAELGIEARIVPMEAGASHAAMGAGEFEVMVGQLSAPATGDMSPLFLAESPYNFGKYRSARADELLRAATSTGDRALAGPHWRELQLLLQRDAPWTMLYYPHTVAGVRSRVRDATPTRLSLLDDLPNWWIDPAADTGTE